MKKALLLASLFLVIASCGGGGSSDSCSFDVNDFTNGANSSAATSVWGCTASGIPDFTFAFYDDGAGYSSALGAFTWDEVGCQAVDVSASNGTSYITDAAGSIVSGIGTFTQTTPTGVVLSVSCELRNL